VIRHNNPPKNIIATLLYWILRKKARKTAKKCTYIISTFKTVGYCSEMQTRRPHIYGLLVENQRCIQSFHRGEAFFAYAAELTLKICREFFPFDAGFFFGVDPAA
jgi:hypothetical protein